MFSFELQHICQQTGARAGVIHTDHGDIPTPVFMPVGTQGTVKGLYPWDLEEIGASIILSNTYHLWMRPGPEIVAQAGGLHSFIKWPHPMLTDSGGFQVFSLAENRAITEEGVAFASHIDGSRQFLSPEKAMDLQHAFGADIIMQLDECVALPSTRPYVKNSYLRSIRWCERCAEAQKAPDHQALFGIVQGGLYPDYRKDSIEQLAKLDLPGYGIGGLSVGESKESMLEILDVLQTCMPEKKPRYLMGVGTPDYLLEGVMRGIDMMDCVIPTRMGRNGCLFTHTGRLTVRNAKYANDFTSPDPACPCRVCRTFTRAYLRHLIKAGEMLGLILASYHNVYYLVHLMKEAREAILANSYGDFVKEFYKTYQFDQR